MRESSKKRAWKTIERVGLILGIIASIIAIYPIMASFMANVGKVGASQRQTPTKLATGNPIIKPKITLTPELPPGTTQEMYSGHSNWVFSVAWSPDGKRIASASADKTVQIWNATDGRNILTYRGHSDVVRSISWSPDGKSIASGSDDGTVQVWDATTGKQKLIYTGDSYPVNSVAWSPNGKEIASGSGNTGELDPDLRGGTVQVWIATE